MGIEWQRLPWDGGGQRASRGQRVDSVPPRGKGYNISPEYRENDAFPRIEGTICLSW